MKSLSRILFMLLAFFLSIEVVWFSCESFQRQQLLEALGRDDLARELQLDPYYPLLSQLYQLRLEDHHRATEDIQQESVSETSDSTINKEATQTPEGQASGWQAKGKHYAAKMLCHKPKTQNLNNVNKQKIYKWLDEHGRTHFGEKPAQANQASNKEIEDLSKQYEALQQAVKLSIEYPNWAGDSLIESELKKQGKMVHKVLSHYVPKSHLRQINLKIILFKNVAEFESHRDDQKANVQWGAYYSSASNSIYLPRYPNIEQTMAIARHEMTHAMIAGMLGPVPVWLNEGLAEYMESFSWRLNISVAQPRVSEYGRLKGASMAALATANYSEFHGDNEDTNYLQAAASVYFLLDHQSGRQWLKRSFVFYAENPCRKASVDQLFASYPGGITNASHNFNAWLRKGKYASHRY
ncbi:MAG: DUF4124 domain-containing protein [Oleispira sp.]|nr:DUF4124 domain-containing protein [Oleispira sp.]MBL4881756.1 DUF4124 domain-containing protein [Oleispira sp.]